MSRGVENLRPSHPEEFELYEYATEGATELNAHVTAHVLTRCASCTKLLDDIRILDRARQAREEWDRFFDDMPGDEASPSQMEEFLKKFKRPAGKKPADRPGRLAYEARAHADAILAAAAGEDGLEKASALIQGLEKDPSRGYAYLFFSQMAIGAVPKDPARYVALARRIAESSRSLPYRNHRGPAQPVCRESVLADAALLESHALNVQGKSAEARETIRIARQNFVLAEDDSFSTALCDYYEGSAASFDGDYRGAWSLLKCALSEFQLYGQQNWIGRAEGQLGTLLSNRGKHESALFYFEAALRNLHPQLDRTAYGTTLANRGYALVKISRLDAAKATYAKALRIAREQGLNVLLLTIRYGLATIELKNQRTVRAVRLFEGIAADARKQELADRIVTAELRIAECLGRLGRHTEMRARVDGLRNTFGATSNDQNPGLLQLFTALDKGDLTAGLVAHVAAYVEDLDHGTIAEYQPFRLIAGGR
jgi:tetratricopeptide (TPR) repeat protein